MKTSTIPETFPALLTRRRTEAGLSVPALARASGLSDDAIRKWESGDRSPSWEAVCKLADAMGTTTDAFRSVPQ